MTFCRLHQKSCGASPCRDPRRVPADFAAIVRAVKAEVRPVLNQFPGAELLQLKLDELPVQATRRGAAKRVGKGGTYHDDGAGGLGRVTINVATCSDAERVRSILLHELAHAIDSWVNGDTPAHGPSWRNIMVRLGQVPRRCHNYQD